MHKFNIAMKFEEAIQKIQYGKCLLLTGAGFSLGAKNYKQDKSAFRIAKYIAHELYNECDVPKENQDDDLRRASQWYIRQYGEDSLSPTGIYNQGNFSDSKRTRKFSLATMLYAKL